VKASEDQRQPRLQPALRYARALPYALHAHLSEVAAPRAVEVRFENIGRARAEFRVYDRTHWARFPRHYSLEAGKGLAESWCAGEGGRYDLQIVGPNGFSREFAGVLAVAGAPAPAPQIALRYHPACRSIELRSSGMGAAATLTITPHAYRHGRPSSLSLACDGGGVSHAWSLARSGDWYDFTVRCDAAPDWSQRFAGRLETLLER
jgi:phospholipase C